MDPKYSDIVHMIHSNLNDEFNESVWCITAQYTGWGVRFPFS